MRLAASLFLATALTVPTVAPASVATLQDDLAAMDVILSWSGERAEAGQAALTDPIIKGSRLHIRADHLLYDERTGSVTLIDARFIDRRGQSGAEATAGELIAQDARSFHLVNEPDLCDPREARDLSPAATELRNLTVVPEGRGEGRMGAERFTVDRLVLRMRVADDGACITFDDAALDGLTTASPRGDTTTLETATLRAEYDGARVASFDLDLRDMSTLDPTGRQVGRLGHMAIAANLTGDLPESPPTDINQAFELLLRTTGDYRIEMHELFIEAPEELGGQEMRGHLIARVQHAEEAIDTELDLDIQGLARLQLDLGLTVLPVAEGGGLGAMLGEQPGLAAAERLAVARLRLSAADQGAVDIAEETAGMGRDEILAELRRQLNVAPQSLVEPIMGFAEAVLDGGAAFRAAPPQPVPLTQILMTGMLQPNMLGTLLAIAPE